MDINNIFEEKQKIRKKCKNYRKDLSFKQKSCLDNEIINKLRHCKDFNDASVIFSYVSLENEIETQKLICELILNNKKVAVPKTQKNSRYMEFYYIKSLSDLEESTFSVLEPKSYCEKVEEYREYSICIVPGLALSKNGYRIGYGKGYYDNFLKDFKGISIGLCYNSCIFDDLPHDKFDRCVDFIITETGILNCKETEKNNEK